MEIQNSFQKENNKLYIVSTPIGNLKDMTIRAVEILAASDLILCEDTRVTGKLLQHFNLKVKMESYQKFNEVEKSQEMINKIKEGMNISLVSDAGTPLINDPGFIITKLAIEQGIDVVSIPGASAMLAALSSSGLVPQPFTFIGFLPRKQSEMKLVLSKYLNRDETLIIYESPLRISKTLELLHAQLGNRKCVLARELTKKFETLYRGELINMKDLIFDERGEYVILLEGHIQIESDEEINVEVEINKYIKNGMDEKDAIKMVAKTLGVHKSEVYRIYKIKG